MMRRPTAAGPLFALLIVACSARTPSPPLPARPALGAPIDRAGRALTGNALLHPLGPDDVADRRKEAYNRASPSTWPEFAAELAETLALYDGFDHICGNQWLSEQPGALVRLLIDDRLWVDSRASTCNQYLALERGIAGDCGGRTPLEDASDIFRSLLVAGTPTAITDGVDHDDKLHSTRDFPFLAAP